MLPPVSEPNAHGTIWLATAAALPPDEPPGTLLKFQGFFVFLKYEFSVDPPIANSSILSFPIVIKFSEFILSITVASYGDTKSSNILELHVVFIPFVQILSLIPIGIPAKLFVISPFCFFLSISLDLFSASSERTVTKASTSFSFSFILFT